MSNLGVEFINVLLSGPVQFSASSKNISISFQNRNIIILDFIYCMSKGLNNV